MCLLKLIDEQPSVYVLTKQTVSSKCPSQQAVHVSKSEKLDLPLKPQKVDFQLPRIIRLSAKKQSVCIKYRKFSWTTGRSNKNYLQNKQPHVWQDSHYKSTTMLSFSEAETSLVCSCEKRKRQEKTKIDGADERTADLSANFS